MQVTFHDVTPLEPKAWPSTHQAIAIAWLQLKAGQAKAWVMLAAGLSPLHGSILAEGCGVAPLHLQGLNFFWPGYRQGDALRAW